MRKWLVRFLYLFIIFLANPTGLKDHSYFGERGPASINETPCYQLLESFYSSERNKVLDARIKYSKDNPYLFFRSFPPMFYKLIEKNKWEDKFSFLVKFKSVITGDSHMENFGLKFYNKKLRFSVNDYDDLTKGPVFLDLVRLLTSAKLTGIDFDKKLVEEFFSKFKKGLKGKKHSYSKTIEDLIDESKKVEMIDDNIVDFKTKFFKKKKTPNTPLSKSDLEKWNSILSEHGVITDSYLYVKESGGSGGLKRFQFAVEKDGKMKWIEAKEWAEPSYDVAANIKGPGDKERYDWIIDYDKPFVAPQLSKFETKTYYLRNIDSRQIGVVIEGLKVHELEDVLIDEAYALGEFHRTYLSQTEEFENALDMLNPEDVVDFVHKLSKEFKDNLKEVEYK